MHNFELRNNNAFEAKIQWQEQSTIPLHEVIFSTIDKPKLLSQISVFGGVTKLVKALLQGKLSKGLRDNPSQREKYEGEAGYQDVIDCVGKLAKLLKLEPEDVLVESTGVIGQRIKKGALLNSLPTLLNSLSSSVEGEDSAAMAITTTDLVSKSVAIESLVGGTKVRVEGMAKESGMIHPNMATMLGVCLI
ncbi:hypothetical protein RIF29_38239 [Crotalaria pallida]|uniref:Uncharacterized protein n=1 Tax=Crotalaria pallida TaxID=3830 RepID=A0AAN9E1W1_CROPI